MVAEAVRALLLPNRRTLITYTFGSEMTEKGFAIEGKKIIRVEKRWAIPHAPCYGLHIDACYWESGSDVRMSKEDIVKANEVTKKSGNSIRKLNIQGMEQ